jgi:hypothetical protein
VVLEALRAGQHKNIYCGVLRVRKTRYYIKNYSIIIFGALARATTVSVLVLRTPVLSL